MSEEKIINTLEGMLYEEDIFKHNDYIETPFSLEQQNAIKGLLDLYNKEKEKNKELQVKNLELLEKIEMKKILIMRKDHTSQRIFGELYILKDELEKNYISKDKIREKIEELEKQKEDKITKKWEMEDNIQIRINAYEELLEGDDK